MNDCVKRLNQAVEKIMPSVISWRRDFHENPELSNREERTSRLIVKRLREMGIEDIQTGIARYGVVALIRGEHSGPCVGLRGDIDALPVTEQTGLPFSSKIPGVMHACGHDCHTAILLGSANVLFEMKEHIHGSVKLIFQPCEEGAPEGEEGGASLMIKEGVLKNPDVASIFALHINPLLETGKISCTPNGAIAAVDSFAITIKGKQTHAAYPWEGDDPILVASHIVLSLQTIVSRIIDTRDTAVVSVGSINGGNRWNIIPDTVVLTGTIRTHDMDVRDRIHKSFERIVCKTAESHGLTAEIDMRFYGPVTWNNPQLLEQMTPALHRINGKDNVLRVPPAMHGEDFAYYAEKIPGLFFKLGVRNEKIGAVNMLHSPNMIVDEDALPTGIKTLVMLAMDYLENSKM